jgi:hypothetical protein
VAGASFDRFNSVRSATPGHVVFRLPRHIMNLEIDGVKHPPWMMAEGEGLQSYDTLDTLGRDIPALHRHDLPYYYQ